MKLAYTVEEAAAEVGLSADVIRQAIHAEGRHKLQAKRSGVNKNGEPVGRFVILHADLVAWLEGLEAA